MFVGEGCVGLPVALVKVCEGSMSPTVELHDKRWRENNWAWRASTLGSAAHPAAAALVWEQAGTTGKAHTSSARLSAAVRPTERTCPRSSSIACLAAVMGWLGAACRCRHRGEKALSDERTCESM